MNTQDDKHFAQRAGEILGDMYDRQMAQLPDTETSAHLFQEKMAERGNNSLMFDFRGLSILAEVIRQKYPANRTNGLENIYQTLDLLQAEGNLLIRRNVKAEQNPFLEQLRGLIIELEKRIIFLDKQYRPKLLAHPLKLGETEITG